MRVNDGCGGNWGVRRSEWNIQGLAGCDLGWTVGEASTMILFDMIDGI